MGGSIFQNKNQKIMFLIVPPVIDCTTGPFLALGNLKAYLERKKDNIIELCDWNIEALSSNDLFLEINKYLIFIQNKYKEIYEIRYSHFHPELLNIITDYSQSDSNLIKVEFLQKFFHSLLYDRNYDDLSNKIENKNLYKIFSKYFRKKIAIFENNEPIAIGFSISFHTQIVPALICSHLIKKQYPQIPIVLGGNFFWNTEIETNKIIMNLPYVDFIIMNEGESSLEQLINFFEKKQTVEKIPNLVWKRNNKITQNECKHPIKLRDIPAPDFGDLPLHLYSPLFIPYLITRGCYWAKCNFCNIPKFTSTYWKRYEVKPLEIVVNDIRSLTEKYGFFPVYFVTTALHPKICKELVNLINQHSISFEWYTMVRADPGFTYKLTCQMYKSGCRHVEIDLEIANNRMLSLMKKVLLLKYLILFWIISINREFM